MSPISIIAVKSARRSSRVTQNPHPDQRRWQKKKQGDQLARFFSGSFGTSFLVQKLREMIATQQQHISHSRCKHTNYAIADMALAAAIKRLPQIICASREIVARDSYLTKMCILSHPTTQVKIMCVCVCGVLRKDVYTRGDIPQDRHATKKNTLLIFAHLFESIFYYYITSSCLI